MARGTKREVGSVRIAPNGYRYIQTETGQRLLHHVLAETKLGRPLRPDERVYFMDGNREHVESDNIEVRRSPSRLSQIRHLLRRLDKLEEEANEIRTVLEESLNIELQERENSIDSRESNRV